MNTQRTTFQTRIAGETLESGYIGNDPLEHATKACAGMIATIESIDPEHPDLAGWRTLYEKLTA